MTIGRSASPLVNRVNKMLRLSRLTDYGMVVISHLATKPGAVMTAPVISDETSLPLATVSKLLKLLARGNLITSHRGAAGGYSLEKAADGITVGHVIQAIEGRIVLVDCVDGAEGSCALEAGCPMRGRWDPVNDAIRKALSSVTVADMATAGSAGVTYDFMAVEAETRSGVS